MKIWRIVCLVTACSISTLMSGCLLPVKWAPAARGKVIDAGTRRAIVGAEVYSRKRDEFRKKTVTSDQGEFSLAAKWILIPIPFAHFYPERELRFTSPGYRPYQIRLSEDPHQQETKPDFQNLQIALQRER
jgi:hypothetical protein